MRLGKIPTTSVRRRISRLSRSWGLLDQICFQCSLRTGLATETASTTPGWKRNASTTPLAATFAQYRGVVEERCSRLAADESDLLVYYKDDAYAHAVYRLTCYRGVDWVGPHPGVGVCDWRRFANASRS